MLKNWLKFKKTLKMVRNQQIEMVSNNNLSADGKMIRVSFDSYNQLKSKIYLLKVFKTGTFVF